MFGLLIIKNKDKPKNNESIEHNDNAQNKIVVDIDYEKLADAIVHASHKIEQEKEEKLQEEQSIQKNNWELALKCKRYNGTNVFHKIFDCLTRPFRTIWGILTFRKKDATFENATYALFRMCNEYLLASYQYLFYFLTLCCGICILGYDVVSQYVNIGIGVYISFLVLFLIIAQTIRIAKLEAMNSQNKETIKIIFDSIVSFTAMVFAIAAVLVTLRSSGGCLCN